MSSFTSYLINLLIHYIYRFLKFIAYYYLFKEKILKHLQKYVTENHWSVIIICINTLTLETVLQIICVLILVFRRDLFAPFYVFNLDACLNVPARNSEWYEKFLCGYLS